MRRRRFTLACISITRTTNITKKHKSSTSDNPFIHSTNQGYEDVYLAGLSGGGWSTTFAAAIDPRIVASFPIAGSVPCEMRNPLG